MYSLILETIPAHKFEPARYRAVILEVDDSGWASVTDIMEAEKLSDLELLLREYWPEITHARAFESDIPFAPEFLTAFEAATAFMRCANAIRDAEQSALDLRFKYEDWDMSSEIVENPFLEYLIAVAADYIH